MPNKPSPQQRARARAAQRRRDAARRKRVAVIIAGILVVAFIVALGALGLRDNGNGVGPLSPQHGEGSLRVGDATSPRES